VRAPEQPPQDCLSFAAKESSLEPDVSHVAFVHRSVGRADAKLFDALANELAEHAVLAVTAPGKNVAHVVLVHKSRLPDAGPPLCVSSVLADLVALFDAVLVVRVAVARKEHRALVCGSVDYLDHGLEASVWGQAGLASMAVVRHKAAAATQRSLPRDLCELQHVPSVDSVGRNLTWTLRKEVAVLIDDDDGM
jgi:hypothetical protein